MSNWTEHKERGSLGLIRLAAYLCRHCHPNWISPLLFPIACYFFFSSKEVKHTSMLFFQKATGNSRSSDYFKQLYCFSRTIMDRFYLLAGQSHHYSVNSHGRDLLLKKAQEGRGIILLGAHLGSFEACQMLAKERVSLDVHIVAYFGASKKIRSTLNTLNPEQAKKVIDPTHPDAIFKMREVIERGGILAILADRVGIGDKTSSVNFMGSEAEFPAGPYLLAHILGCPVYAFFGLLARPYHYENHIECIADKVYLPRQCRQEKLIEYTQTYANHLAHYARQYPYNWFNFYDYWKR